jgi:hypothetical protein
MEELGLPFEVTLVNRYGDPPTVQTPPTPAMSSWK